MTGAAASLVRDMRHRAEGDAALVVALGSLLLVPMPALLASAGANSAHIGRAGVVQTLSGLVAATPLFALMPFVLGCGLGTLLHLVVTAPERFEAIRAERHIGVGARSLVAMSLIVGGTFAAMGLLAAISLF